MTLQRSSKSANSSISGLNAKVNFYRMRQSYSLYRYSDKGQDMHELLPEGPPFKHPAKKRLCEGLCFGK